MKKTVKWLFIQLLILVFLFPFELMGQDIASNNVKKRQKELEQLNNSIKDTRKKINSLTTKERSTVNELNVNQKHCLQLNNYIVLLDEQISDLQREINQHDSVYYGLSYQLRKMISEYTELVKQTYIEGLTSDEEILITDRSFDDDIKREIYTERLTRVFKDNMRKINLMRVAVSNEAGSLKDKSDYQEELKGTKKKEQQYLAYTITKNKRLLEKIKTDAASLKKQLAEKQRSATQLKSIIADLIQKETKKVTPGKSPAKSLPVGKIAWPIDSRQIVRGYGQIKNKETDTYFDNPGIDIAASSGSSVRSVADGEVSMVHWLPGYGTLLIVNHGGGLRSVYANLSSVNVKKGDRLKKGEPIGRSGESVDGEFLHFELWNGSTRLNPRNYLQ
jgi:septal ring factor EnvC (AmiA/AmiB activator)